MIWCNRRRCIFIAAENTDNYREKFKWPQKIVCAVFLNEEISVVVVACMIFFYSFVLSFFIMPFKYPEESNRMLRYQFEFFPFGRIECGVSNGKQPFLRASLVKKPPFRMAALAIAAATTTEQSM